MIDADHIKKRTRQSLNGKPRPTAADSYPEDQRGDAWEGLSPARNGKHKTAPPTQEPEPLEVSYPDPPRKDAYFGLAGDLVRLLEPNTEADAVAILMQTLVSFGSVIGRTAFFQVEGTRHYLNLFAVMVGTTSKGRKGTSWGRVIQLFAGVDPEWEHSCVLNGLSSGEGLIWQVRDAIVKREGVKENGHTTGHQEVEVDPGVKDKRLLVQEAEYCSVLKQIERQGSTLSAIIRQAWETGNIRSLTKNCPAKATDAHISIVGHVTSEELRRYLSSTEAASGFGNRFLWAVVRRSKYLPDGGGAVDLSPLIKRFSEAASFAKAVGQMPRDDEAREMWHRVYPRLSGDRPGLAGSLLARAEAQTMRLACLYALLECSCHVEAHHLQAALALWDFCERSTRYIFGNSTGDPVADEIVDALRHRTDGMTRTEVRDMFNRNKSGERIARTLSLLLAVGLVVQRPEADTGGRPAERWFLAQGGTT